MGKLIIRSHEEFEKHVGLELGVSEYLTVTQKQISQFADATFDHQWIHVDEERAKTEGGFWKYHCPRISDVVASAFHVGPDYSGGKYQNAGELRD